MRDQPLYSNHTHTQACMTDPLITEPEVWHALECLNHHKGFWLTGFPLRLLKSLDPILSLCLPGYWTFPFKLPRPLKIGDAQLYSNSSRSKPRTTDSNQFSPISLTSVVCKILETKPNENMVMACTHYQKQQTRFELINWLDYLALRYKSNFN